MKDKNVSNGNEAELKSGIIQNIACIYLSGFIHDQ
jgi:hypothetical protein